MSQENFELSSNENEDNDVMDSKKAKVIIREVKKLFKSNSTEQEHAS